jgi:beta-lactamase regulating signal transducer with metallopeptidase domain
MLLYGLVTISNEGVEWVMLLLNVLIKATIILLLAKGLVGALKGASAATRHLIWSVAVSGLLLLPALELLLPEWQLPVLPTFVKAASGETGDDDLTAGVDWPAASSEPAKDRQQSAPVGRKTIDELPMTPPYETPLFEDVQSPALASQGESKVGLNWLMVLLIVWSAGFLSVLVRLLAGTRNVWLMARHAEDLGSPYWRKLTEEIAEQLGLQKAIKVLRSNRVTVPMTWGIWRPLVLLPEEASDWSMACSRIVLLHELAHIKRRDCLTQLVAQLACAVYWFNPLVWSAAKRLRIERELACDDQVLETGTRASVYASHLVDIASSYEASGFASPMTVGMACSQLEDRVVAILNPHIKRRSVNRWRVLSACVMAFCLVVPLAVIQPWVSAASLSTADDFKADSVPQAPTTFDLEKQMNEALAKAVEAQTQKLLSAVAHHEDAASHPLDSKNEPAVLPRVQTEHELQPGDREVQEKSTPEAQTDSLTPEQSQNLKRMGITPEFIEAARRMGFDNLTTNQLMQMRVHGVDEEFVRQARAWGYTNLSLNQLLQLRVAGVNTAYVQAMKQAGFENLTVGKLASLKMQNVTPEFIEEMRRLGFTNLPAEKLLSLRVHNINEAFIREVDGWGFGKLSLDELLQIRVHRVTPAFAQEMRSLGFDNLSLNKLVRLRVTGINAEFLNEMRGLGFTNLTLEQAVQMKQHGVNAEYVKKLRAAGYKNVSVNQLIEMKIHGIDEILLKNSK